MRIFSNITICLIILLLLAVGCQKTPPPGPSEQMISKATELGHKLAKLIKEKKHEEAVIELRPQVSLVLVKECVKSFKEAGGTQADWDLIFNAAKSAEFEAGQNYGTKLLANKLQDADVVEYIRGMLRNTADFNKLAFSAGFVSVFKDRQVGRDHLDILWIWALSQ